MLGDKSLMVLVAVAIFTLGLILGGTLGLLNPKEVEILVVTEKVVTVEIEKPIITEKIVEVEIVKEVEVYRFINEDYPVHKWIDLDNQAIVYIYPKGYTGVVWPMYQLVPPVWFDQILRSILDLNNGVMPPEVINAIPKDWLEAVAPGTRKNAQSDFN